MEKFIAFLRGINVGGTKIIKMEVLRDVFISMGFETVKTYIQSGNVIFNSTGLTVNQLTTKIEFKLKESFGYEVPVIIRSFEEIEKIIQLDPFSNFIQNQDIRLYVCFMQEIPPKISSLPIKSEKEALEIIEIINRDAFILSYPLNGHYGFPNNFIEKEFKVDATSRNWNTVMKIYDLMKN